MKTTGKMKVLAVVLIAAVFLLSATSLSAGVSLKNGASTYYFYNVSTGPQIPYTSSYNSWYVVGSQLGLSKLIVNQPNGAVDVTITGELNGLAPSATYRVFLSNQWYYGLPTTWTYTAIYGTATYQHTATISVETIDYTTAVVSFSGTVDGSYSMSGTIMGTAVTMTVNHDNGYIGYLTGTVGTGGVITGTWYSTSQGSVTSPAGTWYTPSNTAATSWQGLFTESIPYFTFTTDSTGSGSWHVNLVDSDFSGGSGTYSMSVWINPLSGGTVFISDNFSVTVTIS